MNTVIIISNDERITLLKEAVQPLLLAKISIVPDFDTGLKEVFEKRPQVVFIQDEISGVKAGTVTRHIKSLLQANSPSFVLFGKSPDLQVPSQDFDSAISLLLPDNDLIGSFREALEKVPALRWKSAPATPQETRKTEQTDVAPADDVFPNFGTSSPEAESFPLFEFPMAAQPEEQFSQPFDFEFGVPTPEPPPAVTSPLTEPTGFPEKSPRSEPVPSAAPDPVNGVPVPTAPPLPSPVSGRIAPAVSLSPAASPSHEEFSPEFIFGADWTEGDEDLPFPVESVEPKRSRLLLFIAGGVVLALLFGGALYYLFRPQAPAPRSLAAPRSAPQPQPVPAAPIPSPSPPAASVRTELPSFVPKDGRDAAYGAAKPGWERYVSPDREFLIYRDKGIIRAMQVIALKTGAIDDDFLASALRELCGDPLCRIESRAVKSGYIVEQGYTARHNEVLLYKKKGSRETRGVVISFP